MIITMLKYLCLALMVSVGMINSFPVEHDSLGVKLLDTNIMDNNQNGYKYQYELEDGQVQSQIGYYKYIDENHPMVLVVEGFYSYIAPDGKTYKVTYIADENGYRATAVDPHTVTITEEIQSPMLHPALAVQSGLPSHLLSLVG